MPAAINSFHIVELARVNKLRKQISSSLNGTSHQLREKADESEECDNVVLAYGKELKGYLGDIIRTMYTGERKGSGDYILESDRHGMICKLPYGESWELYVWR